MIKTAWRAVFVVPALLAWACAGTPGPGDDGYPFNLSGTYTGQFSVEGDAFGANMVLRTLAGGTLEGEYNVTSPVEMVGSVTGSVVADSVSFSLDYMNPMDGCGGVLDASGTVASGGAEISGRARVDDSCGGVLAGTFAFRK